ncbi:ATP-binding protein [Bacillus sp. S/N-304-OC-R1]|uniref:hybrid sensor histidine kinase/response regulator n=1 Tax=Bacillus sp. S/N-304-OC-R1 TaxID=2758034 RepID=UPI001C8DF7B4|nr:ATP-binding protein [Bacillus sp. S/N-304-OC-R1]MBY0121149.1 response regulator [Bacillus sp. S/N-304-OC-R1]
MNIKHYKFLILIVILLIALSGYQYFFHQDKVIEVKAIDGVLDLRQYELTELGPIKLDGEWEFVPGKLVKPEEFDQQNVHTVPVPSLWKNYSLEGKEVPRHMKGTYRLKILVSHPNQIFGVKTSNIRMSNTVYVDGKLVGQSGMPDEKRTYVQHNIPYVAYFSPKGKEIEVLVHVANFDYASGGGIISSIFFGDQAGIGSMRENALAYDWVTIAAFSTMFIYFLGTYFHARIRIEQLYFALFCFANALYTLCHGEKVFLSVFPNTPYEIFERLQSISSIIIGLFMLLYFYQEMKDFAHRKIAKALYITGITLSFTSLLPVSINSTLQIYYSIYIFLVFVFIFYIEIIAINRRAKGAIYLLMSSMAIFVYFIVGTLNVMVNVELTLLPPLLPFICLAMLSLFISGRFTDSYLEKEELTTALMKVDKLKDEVLAKTSHEFRTPLHGIISISQSLLDKRTDALTDEQREKMTLIVNIARRLSLLVNDILDFSKLKERELKLHITAVDLFSSTHMIVETFAYMLKKEVKIFNKIERGQTVLADEERLRQILYNVIENAIKYTSHGYVEISSYAQGESIVIQISDTGVGIPPDNMGTLFEPFRQFENSVGGTGLGLSVTKELVDLLGGSISVQSTVGEGTSFFITLPKSGRKTSEKEKRDQLSLQLAIPYVVEKTGKKKIIVADDDHVNLKVLIDTLADEEYFIIAVDSGEAVLSQLQKHRDADIMILDIMMPGMSGYEVCKLLRKSYLPSELPVLMLTAAVRPEDMVAAFQSGANDFLHKPLDSSELKTRIRNLLLMKESAQTATKMEMAFLQAQIKPHFIYNVLNSILSLSYIDLDKARSMITDFAQFLRGSFSFENTNMLVPLEKELSLVQSYVNIHRVRFPNQLNWEIRMEAEINSLIPPLLLQPIVENAILHGLSQKHAGGKVTLSVKEEKGMAIIQITDNGKGLSQEEIHQLISGEQNERQGVAIHNIIRRLKYYEDASIHYYSVEGVGTTVEIKFPLNPVSMGRKQGEVQSC